MKKVFWERKGYSVLSLTLGKEKANFLAVAVGVFLVYVLNECFQVRKWLLIFSSHGNTPLFCFNVNCSTT